MAVSETPTGAYIPARLLPSLTLIQTKTAIATGKGHQDAKAAMGTITFYNGLFASQTIAAGTTLTGSDSVQVVTDQTGTIPPNIPPQDGQAHIAAHALQAGQTGNIQALDINGTVSSSLFVKNLAPFSGGQNERDFATVTRDDIQRVVTSLTPHLLQSEQAALTAQLTASEALAPPTCTPTVTADHGPGSEAATIQVTVSERCTGVAYNQQAVQVKASQLLTSVATTQLGTSYTLTGTVHVTITQASVTNKVAFSLACTGTWVYTFSLQEQQQIKHLIAGRTKHDALQLLLSQSGIHKTTIVGIGNNELLPDVTRIHLLIMVEG